MITPTGLHALPSAAAIIRLAPIGCAPVARVRRPRRAGDGCGGARAPCRLRSDSASDFNGFDDKGDRYRGVVSNLALCVPDKMHVAQTRHVLAMRHGHTAVAGFVETAFRFR